MPDYKQAPTSPDPDDRTIPLHERWTSYNSPPPMDAVIAGLVFLFACIVALGLGGVAIWWLVGFILG